MEQAQPASSCLAHEQQVCPLLLATSHPLSSSLHTTTFSLHTPHALYGCGTRKYMRDMRCWPQPVFVCTVQQVLCCGWTAREVMPWRLT